MKAGETWKDTVARGPQGIQYEYKLLKYHPQQKPECVYCEACGGCHDCVEKCDGYDCECINDNKNLNWIHRADLLKNYIKTSEGE